MPWARCPASVTSHSQFSYRQYQVPQSPSWSDGEELGGIALGLEKGFLHLSVWDVCFRLISQEHLSQPWISPHEPLTLLHTVAGKVTVPDMEASELVGQSHCDMLCPSAPVGESKKSWTWCNMAFVLCCKTFQAICTTCLLRKTVNVYRDWTSHVWIKFGVVCWTLMWKRNFGKCQD